MSHPYICIHCGKPATVLYREYTKDLLKISHCDNCNKPIDNYIETETSIILIDAILQRKEAYRHIIYNKKVKFVWKLAIVFLLCDAYQKWVTDRAIPWNVQSTSDEFVYLELEWNFYVACFKAALENTLFVLLIIAQIYIIYRRKISHEKITNLLHGLVIFGYGKVFFLPAVLWGMYGGTMTNFLIIIFVLISEIQVCTVVIEISKSIATVIVLGSYVLQQTIPFFAAYLLKHRLEIGEPAKRCKPRG